MKYFMARESLLGSFIVHIDSVSITDLLCTLMWDSGSSAESASGGGAGTTNAQWFHEHDLIPQLVAKLGPHEDVWIAPAINFVYLISLLITHDHSFLTFTPLPVKGVTRVHDSHQHCQGVV